MKPFSLSSLVMFALAVAFPGRELTLIDGTQKKIRFVA